VQQGDSNSSNTQSNQPTAIDPSTPKAADEKSTPKAADEKSTPKAGESSTANAGESLTSGTSTNQPAGNEDTDKHGHKNDQDAAKNTNEFESVDSLAQNAFYLTIIFLSIFVCLFIYNIVRCYTRSSNNPPERPAEQKNYSRELQHSTNPEDTTLDLAS